MKKNRAYFNWSGGKDSALSLYHIKKDDQYDVELLLTSVNAAFDRVSMHGVRNELLAQQAESIGLPLKKIELPEMPSMDEYNNKMQDTIGLLKNDGFTHAVFGDIFLEDLRIYREEQLVKVGIQAHFPIWKRDTKELLKEFLDLGFKTIIVCIKSELLDPSFSGRIIDYNFINEIPSNVDPCGENGEFHTFVFDGPIFEKPIDFIIGEKVYREYKAPQNKEDNCFSPDQKNEMGFWFCDLIPVK